MKDRKKRGEKGNVGKDKEKALKEEERNEESMKNSDKINKQREKK